MSSTVGVEGPTPIYPSGMQTALTVKNVGAGTVWLDNAPIMTSTGLPLGPGSSLVWDAKRPLFAYGNSQLSITENSGNIFDAQAVADSIVAGGLAVDIANAISIQGVPTIVRYTQLTDGYFSTLGDSIDIPVSDVYGTLRVHLAYFSGATSWTAPVTVTATYLGVPTDQVSLHVVPTDGHYTDYDIPALSSVLRLQLSEVPAGVILYYAVTGVTSNSTMPRMMHSAAAGVAVQNGTAVPASISVLPGGGVTFRLNSLGAITGRIWSTLTSGRNFVSFKVNGGSAAAALQFNDSRNGDYNAVAIVETTGGKRIANEIVLPATPMNIYYSFGTGATSAEISIQPC